MGNRFFALAGGAVLSVCASLGATAQLDFQAMRQFQNANPDARFYDNEGTIDAIYGTVFSTGATPLESAWNYINRWEGMFGEDIGEFVPNVKENGEILQGVMYNRDTGIHKFYTFRFNQEWHGIPDSGNRQRRYDSRRKSTSRPIAMPCDQISGLNETIIST